MARTTPPMASASSSTGITTSGTDGEPTVRSEAVPALAVLVPAGLLVGAARVVGIQDIGDLRLGGPPLGGQWGWWASWRTLVPAVVGGVLVAVAPAAAERLRWRTLLLAAWIAATVFAVALAWSEGPGAIAEPLTTGYEYRTAVPEIERVGVGEFVRTFVERLPEYRVHVRGHPVGAPLFFWWHERIGLEGAAWSAALVIAGGTSVVVSVATVVRRVVGEAAARRAVPFLVTIPAIVWVATSADALIAGVVAAAVALVVTASYRPHGTATLLAVSGGAAGAAALHLSYGAVLMLLPGVVVVAARRRVRVVLAASIGAATVTAAFVSAGFWWFDGLAATRVEYFAGAGGERPYWYFVALGNPAALLIALGPAVPVALARLRDHRLWLVTGAALAGVVIADLSGLSKAEVERIWLPFVPWLAAAAAVVPLRSVRWWLAAQVTTALVLQATLDAPW